MKEGDIVKLTERFLEYCQKGKIRREKTILRRFRVLRFLPENLVQVRRLDTKKQEKEIYWREFLKEE